MDGNQSFLTSQLPNKIPKFTPKLNIGVLASGEGTNFEALCKACNDCSLDVNIKLLIVNNSKAGVIDRAKRFGVQYLVVDHKNFPDKKSFENQIVNNFKQNNVEGIVMAGWMRIASSVLINAYKKRIINIHPSLLPSFKGIDAIEQALQLGVKITGCTIHYVGYEVDSGPIIIQSAVPISKLDNKESLRKKIQTVEHKLLPVALAIAGEEWREKSN